MEGFSEYWKDKKTSNTVTARSRLRISGWFKVFVGTETKVRPMTNTQVFSEG